MTAPKLPKPCWLLLLTVWFASTLFLRGDIGWWNDDFLFNLRDPHTGAIESLYHGTLTPFSTDSVGTWRPLFNLITPVLVTLCWDHPWIEHLLAGLIHLGFSLATFRLLREFRLGLIPAYIGALLIAAYPAGFEAVFWASSISTELASLLLLQCMILLARDAHSPARWRRTAAVAAALPIPLLNEQPAACLALLPLVVWAALPPGASLTQAIRRFWLPIAIIAAWCVLYMAALKISSAGAMGPSGLPLVPLSDWPHRFSNALTDVAKGMIFCRDLGEGALSEGIRALADQLLLSALLVIALVVFTIGSIRWSRAHPQPPGSPAPGRLWLLAAAWLIAGVLPMAAIGLGTSRPRMFYVMEPTLALAVALFATALPAGRTALRVALGAVFATVILAGTVAMIAAQRGYAHMWALDNHIAAQLRARIPDPGPDAVLVILDDRSRAVTTSRWRFDAYFLNTTKWNFASPYLGRWVFGRADTETITYKPEPRKGPDGRMELPEAPPIFAADSSVFITSQAVRALAKTDPVPSWLLARGGGGTAFSWSRAIPVTIDGSGAVHIVTRMELSAPGSAPVAIELPRTAELARSGTIPALTWTGKVGMLH